MLQQSFFLVISLFLISCTTKEIETPKVAPIIVKEVINYTPFTTEVIDEYELNKIKIKQLQFYNSHEITLEREKHKNIAEIKDGKLLVEDSREASIVLIKAFTPGRVIEVQDEKIVVCFDSDIVLTFLNPYCNCRKKSGKFYFAAEHWSDKVGSLMLGDKEYSAKGISGKSFLMIDKKEILDESKVVRIIEGERVNLKK